MCWFARQPTSHPPTYLPIYLAASFPTPSPREPIPSPADPPPDHVDRIGERPMILRDVATDRRYSCSGSQSGNNPYMRIHGRTEAPTHVYTHTHTNTLVHMHVYIRRRGHGREYALPDEREMSRRRGSKPPRHGECFGTSRDFVGVASGPRARLSVVWRCSTFNQLRRTWAQVSLARHLLPCLAPCLRHFSRCRRSRSTA